ncbi:HAAS domain-containing protein [Salipaludibacillus agaradhaerens]|uniref:HAAS domain-containing protein n=1 Tax=Salipaludibacillus agaradhaerens TaxID=76935 RepID=UPI003B84693E
MSMQLLKKKLKNEVKRVGQLQLSEKSKKFIDDLKLYLFSNGKNDKEIKEITEELEVHLYEAELNGKSVDRIIGPSPKEYMQSISSEMKTDYKAWVKYIPLIIMSAFSFSVFVDLLQGTLSYSLLKIIGTFVYSIIFFIGIIVAFRYVARNQVTSVKEFIILLLPVFISTLFIGGVIIADSIYTTPIVNFGKIGSGIIGLFLVCFVIAFSIWARNAILPVTLIALCLPTIVLSLTSYNQESQLIVGMLMTYLLIGVYLFYVFKREKKKSKIIS